jgi:hypothetical protein
MNSKFANEEGNAKKHLSKKIQKEVDRSFQDIVGLLTRIAKEVGLGFKDCNSHVLLYYHKLFSTLMVWVQKF